MYFRSVLQLVCTLGSVIWALKWVRLGFGVVHKISDTLSLGFQSS